MPPAGYAQSYYTLKTVYFCGIPPPKVHVNCIVHSIKPSSFPSSSTTASLPEKAANGAHNGHTPSALSAASAATTRMCPPTGAVPPSARESARDEWQGSEAEKEAFDAWLRARWAHKDRMMDAFYEHGDFMRGAYSRRGGGERLVEGAEKREGMFVEIPLRMRNPLLEVPSFYAFGLGPLAWAGLYHAAKNVFSR